MILNSSTVETRSYARTGRVRVSPGYRTEPTRCRFERAAMTAMSHERSTFWNPQAQRTPQFVHKPNSHAEAMIEWEFGDVMRSAHLPPGWFVLPSAALGFLSLLALVH